MTPGEAIKNEHMVDIPLELLHKIPSINDNISYTLVSLIMHVGDSLYCVHYVSDNFGNNTGILWHCDGDNIITQISDLPEGVYFKFLDMVNVDFIDSELPDEQFSHITSSNNDSWK